MNKIDQIKMKVLFEQKVIEEKKKSGTFSNADNEKWEYVDHVLNLLSRLEIAEKALDSVTEWLEHDELKLSTELRDELKKLRALQQMRKGG